jgi:hypothetical protein
LLRKHRIPIHCPRCSRAFETEEDRDDHVRIGNCEILPKKIWEGVSESQKRLLEKRAARNKTTKENWYFVFELLFPGKERPEAHVSVSNVHREVWFSFAIDTDRILADDILQLRQYTMMNSEDIIREAIGRQAFHSLDFASDLMRDYIHVVFKDAVDILLERWDVERKCLTTPLLGHIGRLSDSGYASGGQQLISSSASIYEAQATRSSQFGLSVDSSISMDSISGNGDQPELTNSCTWMPWSNLSFDLTQEEESGT